VASHGERNDRRPPHFRGAAGPRERGKSGKISEAPAAEGNVAEWIWGRHPVEAALCNPARTSLRRLVAAPGKADSLPVDRMTQAGQALRVEVLEPAQIDRLTPAGAVHQGLALLADPPEPADLETVATPAQGLIVLLDSVADPQNVGGVFRCAAAFGARAVILQARRAPPLSGALAKAAAGAVDKVPCVRVVNLSRTLDELADLGWRAIGLDAEAATPLEAAFDGGPVVLVMGSEGEGLRRLVSEHCDLLAKIPMPGGFESLNVATATAIALYEAAKPRLRTPER
jgi:23S rRNA (guanosine2251-2'-O)-methyltransferase